jgi:hypothetical protein
MPRYRRLLNALVMLLTLALPSPNAICQVRGYFPKQRQPGVDTTVQDVSVVQLIAEPQKYDGKEVRFIGFLRIEFEGDAVYLHREDYEFGISQNALWIDIPHGMTKQQQDAVNMRYVICVGIFRASRHGHMGMFSGEISDVQRLELWLDQQRSARPLPSPPGDKPHNE